MQALEVEQPVVELLAGLLVDVLDHLGGDGGQGGHGHEGGHLVGELVGVLAGRRHTHRARPVVVHVRQLVADLLNDVGLEAGFVVDHDVVGGGDGALAHVL